MARSTLPLARWAMALVLAALLTPAPARSDELDALLLIREGQPLRDQWEECAASVARPRLASKLTAERIADEAFHRCRARESKLRDFLANKIGRQKASAIILLLREQYRSDLSAAIAEKRGRD